MTLADRSGDLRVNETWLCPAGHHLSTSCLPSARPRPPRRYARCWIAWDATTKRYGGYLEELPHDDLDGGFVESAPNVRSLPAVLAWAREVASIVFVRPEWDPDRYYSAGQRRGGRRGIPSLPSKR